MKLLIYACAGGAIGAGLRHLSNMWFASRGWTAFPWSTLAVNVVGSLAMGVIMALVVHRLAGSPEVRTFVATGILGGLTTFSAYSLDAVTLWEAQQPVTAITYTLISVVLSIFALVIGLWVTRIFVS